MRLDPASRVALVCLVLLTATAPSERKVLAQTRRDAPPTVLNYEPLDRVEIASGSTEQERARGVLHASLHGYGRQFDLELEPNDIFTQDAEDVLIDEVVVRRQRPARVHYKGVVRGDADSWVRLSMRNGVLNGIIRMADDTYLVESRARFFADPSEAGMVLYRLADTVSIWQTGSCAALSADGADSSGASDFDALVSELGLLVPASAPQTLEISLVADEEYVRRHGSGSEALMQDIINEVDGIYRQQVQTAIKIKTTAIYASGDPFSGTTDAGSCIGTNCTGLLYELSRHRSASSSLRNTDLTHLFTGRDLNGSTIGVAFTDMPGPVIKVLCSPTWGAGLSTDFGVAAHSMRILVAHEIGHNFGAPHDGRTFTATIAGCLSTPSGFIMWPSLSAAQTFSSCSKGYMSSAMADATCLSAGYPADPGGGPVPTGCTGTLSPMSRDHGARSKGGRFQVTAASSCTWTAKSNASWITISSATTNTGDKRVSYRLQPNALSSPRTGTLTVAGRTFTVTQRGASD